MKKPSTAEDWLARADGTHALEWSGIGSGGHWRQQIARQPDHRYRSTLVLEHDLIRWVAHAPRTARACSKRTPRAPRSPS